MAKPSSAAGQRNKSSVPSRIQPNDNKRKTIQNPAPRNFGGPSQPQVKRRAGTNFEAPPPKKQGEVDQD